jgi:hypothetical protein
MIELDEIAEIEDPNLLASTISMLEVDVERRASERIALSIGFRELVLNDGRTSGTLVDEIRAELQRATRQHEEAVDALAACQRRLRDGVASGLYQPKPEMPHVYN